jgi:hypothetical protein
MAAAYARVRFDSYTPRQVLRAGGVRRLVIGQPHWSHISTAEVEALIGSWQQEARRPHASRSDPDEDPCS